MRKIVLSTLGILAIAAIVGYLADYAILRYRVSRALSPYDSVTVRLYYKIQEKNQRIEYAFDSAQQQTCVNSLFPHFGFSSCWYVRRHTERPINI